MVTKAIYHFKSRGEKVKDYICDCTYIKEPDYTNVRRKIDNQIKLLKGEKDVKD